MIRLKTYKPLEHKHQGTRHVASKKKKVTFFRILFVRFTKFFIFYYFFNFERFDPYAFEIIFSKYIYFEKRLNSQIIMEGRFSSEQIEITNDRVNKYTVVMVPKHRHETQTQHSVLTGFKINAFNVFVVFHIALLLSVTISEGAALPNSVSTYNFFSCFFLKRL